MPQKYPFLKVQPSGIKKKNGIEMLSIKCFYTFGCSDERKHFVTQVFTSTQGYSDLYCSSLKHVFWTASKNKNSHRVHMNSRQKGLGPTLLEFIYLAITKLNYLARITCTMFEKLTVHIERRTSS